MSTAYTDATEVKKIKSDVSTFNPPTQRKMARRLGVSPASVNKVIHHRFGYCKKKKVMVHDLTEKMVTKRKERAFTFHNLSKGPHYEYILTMDEALLSFDGRNGPKDPSERSDGPLLQAIRQATPLSECLRLAFHDVVRPSCMWC